jgi:hypothetical protein
VMPAAASAATSGAGTPAAAKEAARGAAVGLARRCLARGAEGLSVGRADKK